MLGKFIAAIVSRITKGNYSEAQDLLTESYHTLLKEDAAKFTFIPKEELTVKLIEEHHFNNGHLEILAQLFNVEAQLKEAQQNYPLSIEFYEKSLLLHEFLEKKSQTFSLQRNTDIEHLKDKVLDLKKNGFAC
ncbi:MAG: hypothetical protein LBV41_07930 [Cytophagaceae bacterium]|nr:hypothetical protein [Cytophagaceae bacterium]